MGKNKNVTMLYRYVDLEELTSLISDTTASKVSVVFQDSCCLTLTLLEEVTNAFVTSADQDKPSCTSVQSDSGLHCLLFSMFLIRKSENKQWYAPD